MRDHPRSGCPINAGLEALGDPWALLVLRDVIFGNRRHFRELLTQSEEGIASNILASRLKGLVGSGLLTRDSASRGQRATYSLTEAGIQTVPIMVVLGSWGLAHRSGTPELRARAEVLRKGGPQLWEQIMDELRETHLGVPRPRSRQPSTGRLPADDARRAALARTPWDSGARELQRRSVRCANRPEVTRAARDVLVDIRPRSPS